MLRQKRPQSEIFNSFGWWDKGCFLYQMTGDRCDYIESRIDRVFGPRAFAQQEILDVGCGGGLICEELASRGAMVTGIDPNGGALAVAREHSRRSRLGQLIAFDQGSAEALPYADGSFSVITCFDVLEHVHDLRATIREISRVLAPGGIFVFDTINRTFLARALLIWYGEHFPSGGLLPGLHDYHDFIKPQELRSVLVANGLRVPELTGFIPRGFKQGHFKMGPGWFMSVSYVGYATKGR